MSKCMQANEGPQEPITASAQRSAHALEKCAAGPGHTAAVKEPSGGSCYVGGVGVIQTDRYVWRTAMAGTR
eukprot:363932-Chlamydomonas_euryale.AAC.10